MGRIGAVEGLDGDEFVGEGLDALAYAEVDAEEAFVLWGELGERGCGGVSDHGSEHNLAAAGCKGVLGLDTKVDDVLWSKWKIVGRGEDLDTVCARRECRRRDCGSGTAERTVV